MKNTLPFLIAALSLIGRVSAVATAITLYALLAALVALLLFAATNSLSKAYFIEWGPTGYQLSNYYLILGKKNNRMLSPYQLLISRNTFHGTSNGRPDPPFRIVESHRHFWLPIHYQEEEHFANEPGNRVVRRAYCYDIRLPYLTFLTSVFLLALHAVPAVRRAVVGTLRAIAWLCATPVRWLLPKRPARFPID